MSKDPIVPENFSITNGYGVFRPVTDAPLHVCVALVDDVIDYCRANRIAKLLVDIYGLTGFPSPSLVDRFWIYCKWAATARGQVVMVLVAPSEMILPDKFGVTMGQNRGFRSNAFPDEAESVAWLLAEKDPPSHALQGN